MSNIPIVHTINGIRRSAEVTTDRVGMRMHFNHKYEWAKIHVPVTHTWDAWSKRYSLRVARKHILGQVIPGSDVIAHSHGCQLAWAAMYVWNVEMGHSTALFRRLVFLGPAMNRKRWKWEQLEFEAMRVIYNPWDIAIRLGAWVPGHSFGRAGARGFSTDDPRIDNIAKTSFDGPFNHSAPYFREPALDRTVLKAHQFFSATIPTGGA